MRSQKLKKFKQVINRVNTLDLVNFLIISTSVFLIFGNMITRTAIDPEAILNYRYMRESTLIGGWTGETFPGHFTTYRPVMVTLLRLEYLLFGLNPPVFFSINVVLLILLAWILYKLIARITHETTPALVAALLLITDWRLIQNIKVICEVQITLAGILGFWALWQLWFGKGKYKPVLVFFLLLMAALSKEFGLAFALVVFIDALLINRAERKKYIWIAMGAVLSYMVMRFLTGTMPASARTYSSILNQLKWLGVNTTSGFIFTFVNLFRPGSDGELPALKNLRYTNEEVWPIVLLQIVPLFIFFLVSFKNKEQRRYTIPLLFLLLGNSILMSWRYAYRFHFLGNLSMYTLVGFGINHIFQKWVDNIRSRNLLFVLFIFFGVILFWRGESLHTRLEGIVATSDRAMCYERGYSPHEIDECLNYRSLCIPTDEYYQQKNYNGYYSHLDSETIRLVMEYYQLPVIDCTCLDPSPNCK